jgi:hypothetical protein
MSRSITSLFKPVSALTAVVLLSACTAVKVSPLASASNEVCIEENPKVLVSDFVQVLQAGFNRHGIQTRLYRNIPVGECHQIITYTALRSWDMAPYLSSADIQVLDAQRRPLASAHYHLRNKGGLSLAKWAGTEAKIGPVLDQLLASTHIQAAAPSPAVAVTTANNAKSVEQQINELRQLPLTYEEYQNRYDLIIHKK